jgi:organic hydroperoxide reductase OsmC/OhrA
MSGKTHFYETAVIWTGNRGDGTASYQAYGRDHILRVSGKSDLALSSDPAFRGDGSKFSPEELFVASLASCHMLWYLHLCADAGIVVIAYEDHAEATMTETEPGRFEAVVLHPRVILAKGDPQAAEVLHEDAHRKCFIANSVNFPVSCEPKVIRGE